jgi:hypothetical protein
VDRDSISANLSVRLNTEGVASVREEKPTISVGLLQLGHTASEVTIALE